ncbi:hypothetical protein FNK43_09055 (plasmid) [Staphylococcus agnetis]|uniref:hypothetical protein n=1 Tax=Staphylococcus agnetis TaxID=985762 RepID=UPI001181368E|nr:hypothetical protein [Staphylococcus agnetis]TRW80380.1 hypothetical protein FNK43_09055 [Staphylococcus agnetis]
MDKNIVLDKGCFIAAILNVFFLLGLSLVSRLENLYILIPYVILMGINAIYLVVKVGKINRDNSKI